MPTTTDPITADNHSGWVSVSAALFLSWSLSTLAVRAWIRLRLHGPWGYDDSLITLASCFAIFQAIAIFIAVHHSYGLRFVLMPKVNIPQAERALYAAQILYIASICASKLSSSFLVARLTRVKAHIRASYAVSAVTAAWGASSIIAVALRGDISQPWATVDGQQAMFVRWIGIETISMLLEVALYSLAVFLVWGLQMSRMVKTLILAAFACRLAIIPITCVRLYYLNPAINPDLSFSTVYASIVTQVVLHYTLIAATIPCTKPFMRPFNSGYVPSAEGGTSSQFPSNSRGGNHYIISAGKSVLGTKDSTQTTVRSKSSKSESASWSRGNIRTFGDSDFRSDRTLITSTVESKGASNSKEREGTELQRLRSNEMVIRQITEWDVQREPATLP